MRTQRAVVSVFGALLVTLATATVSTAETLSVTLEVTPDNVALAPTETVHAIITARLAITTIQAITLTAFTDVGVKVEIDNPTRTMAPILGDLVWALTVTRSTTGRSSGKVFLRADFQSTDGSGRLIPGVATASLDIQERLAETIDKVVTAEIQTSSDTLQDQQSRYVFLIVKNISSVPVTVTHITPQRIPKVTIKVQPLKNGVRLEPQQSNPFSMKLKAGTSVQSGKHYLVTRIDAEWEKSGQTTNGSLVLSKELSIGVFGEAALLQFTGIPSVFLLPGFLFLLTLSLLVKWSWKRTLFDTEKKTLFDTDFKKPEFWGFAITISLIAMLFYSQATRPFLEGVFRRKVSPDLLRGYGFNDILLLWLGFVLLGIGTWAIVSASYKVCRWCRAYQERRRSNALVPAENDLPLNILRKIANNKKTLNNVERRTYPTGDKEPQNVYLLPSGIPEEGKVWVAPKILVTLKKKDNKTRDELDKLTQNVTENIDVLINWFNSKSAQEVTTSWDTEGVHIKKVTKVDENKTAQVTTSSESFFRRV